MTILRKAFAACFATTIALTPAGAQFGSLDLRGLTVGVAVNSPMGEFDRIAKTGFGIAIRSGMASNVDVWSGRSSFSFDRFEGVSTYSNIQFVTLGFDIIHRTRESFYQFGGIGLYNTRFTAKAFGIPGANSRNEQNFGLTGGVGVNFGEGAGPKGFVEFAATTVFSSGERSSWFPVRLGVRF